MYIYERLKLIKVSILLLKKFKTDITKRLFYSSILIPFVNLMFYIALFYLMGLSSIPLIIMSDIYLYINDPQLKQNRIVKKAVDKVHYDH